MYRTEHVLQPLPFGKNILDPVPYTDVGPSGLKGSAPYLESIQTSRQTVDIVVAFHRVCVGIDFFHIFVIFLVSFSTLPHSIGWPTGHLLPRYKLANRTFTRVNLTVFPSLDCTTLFQKNR